MRGCDVAKNRGYTMAEAAAESDTALLGCKPYSSLVGIKMVGETGEERTIETTYPWRAGAAEEIAGIVNKTYGPRGWGKAVEVWPILSLMPSSLPYLHRIDLAVEVK